MVAALRGRTLVAQSWTAIRAHPTPRDMGLIVVGWLIVLLVIPPQHEFPTTDDWVYAGSVRDMLRTGTFIMPDSQANLVGLTLW
ncbi:MAG TPA: hypothetical protein VM536_18355, partial [Chloroflexia bacterium]|nr:hypothetical protein [Chloroflexia bacterium]